VEHPKTCRLNVLRTSHRGRDGGWALVLLASAAVAISISGCGKARRDRAEVTGTVTYNGTPLRFGTVIFEPETGQYATGAIQPDGSFRMTTRGEGDGVPVGKCKVRIVCFANQDPSAKHTPAKGDPPRGEGLALGAPLIPKKYLSSATSGITVEVKPGENKPLLLELTDH